MFQKKTNPVILCQFKFADDGTATIEGYASVFDSNDSVNDTIKKGAFVESIKGKIPMFVNHDHSDIPVGSFKATEDDHGLLVQGDINLEHHLGKSVYSAVKRGDVTGMSIGFGMNRDGYTEKSGGGRVITDLDLKEVSIVTFPCETEARITAVKQQMWEQCETKRDLEQLIRDELNVSKSVACTLLSHCQRVLSGDLTKLEAEIRALKSRLNQRDTESLYETLKKLGE